MTETINYSFSFHVASGPKVSDSDKLEVEAYGMLEVEVPDKDTSGGTATVDVQPSSSGVKLLIITADSYDDLTYAVDGGSAITLDAPHLLVGEGAAKLLGTTQKQFVFTNAGTEDITVNILVGRKATI